MPFFYDQNNSYAKILAMRTLFILPILIYSFISFDPSFAGTDPHTQKCMVFTSVSAMADGNASLNFASEVEVCKKFNGDILKVCSEKNYKLCGKKNAVFEMGPKHNEIFVKHLAAMVFGMSDEYGKRNVKQIKVLSNNKDIEHCFIQFERSLISKVGNSPFKLLNNYLKLGKALNDKQYTKILSLFDRIISDGIDQQKTCLKNAGINEDIGGENTCLLTSSISSYSPTLQRYCSGKASKSINIEQTDKKVYQCNRNVSFLLFTDYIRSKNLKTSTLKKVSKYCYELKNVEKVCNTVKQGACKSSVNVKNFISKLKDKELTEESYLAVMNKTFSRSFFKTKKDNFYRNSANIESEMAILDKTNFTMAPDSCATKSYVLTDSLFEMAIHKWTFDYSQRFAEISTNRNTSDFNSKISKLMQDYNNELNYFIETIYKYSSMCAKQTSKDNKHFQKLFCGRYNVYLSSLNKSKVKKLCD